MSYWSRSATGVTNLVPIIAATKEELEQAMEDELQGGAAGFLKLAKKIGQY